MDHLKFIIIVILLIHRIQSTKLPKTFQICNRNSNDFQQCLSKAIEDAIHQLTKPFPNVGIPSFKPLEIPSIRIGEGKGVVNVVQNFKNVQLFGITDIHIESATMDFDKKLLTINSTVPQIKQIADYDFNGRILLLPIIGKGPSLLQLDQMNLFSEIEFDEVLSSNNKEFLQPKHARIAIEPNLVYFKFDNLFNGDEKLTNNTNLVLNENWREVFADVKPNYELVYGEILLKLAMNVFKKVPIDDIFID